ncbi:OFA family MFS transporter [Actinotalea sp. M2MS4P-6]|uniref:L-lactate MFS transporter n=1 Tax=Actinotalea sp. M2MS4P-6 TaxID=2983762 RepID=UPI0021E40A47|nr:OFA family MFS transporter [Actinotalea sp. M2MS4P-6]MCV2394297.1 OFA family MFS transporter [Actinotalea sp. M2MS4P-6]
MSAAPQAPAQTAGAFVGAPHRWRVLAASVLIVVCTGVIYSFSVFAGPLQAAHGWSAAQVTLAFSVNGALAPIPMVVGGVLLDRGWARPLMVVGAVLFGLGFAMSGVASTPGQLVWWYGVVTAFGLGFCYSTAVSNTVRLFPDRRGLAAGLITAGVGLGTVIGAPVASAVIASAGVSAAFVRMGVVYGVVACAAALFVRSAPVGPASPDLGDSGATDGVPWHRMVRSPRFVPIFAAFATVLFGPLMLLSQLAGIGQSTWYGLSAAASALFVAAFSACNALGGPAWGVVADRRGAPAAVMLMAAVGAVSFAVLLTVHSPLGFAIGVLGLGSCFGGALGVFPALTMATFGPRYQGTNYAIMFVAYSVAAFVGPRVIAAQSLDGTWTVAFAVALVMSAAGLGLAALLRRGAAAPVPIEGEPA